MGYNYSPSTDKIGWNAIGRIASQSGFSGYFKEVEHCEIRSSHYEANSALSGTRASTLPRLTSKCPGLVMDLINDFESSDSSPVWSLEVTKGTSYRCFRSADQSLLPQVELSLVESPLDEQP